MDRWKSAAVLEPWAGLGYNAMQGHLTFHLWNEGNTYDPLSQGPWPLSDFSRERARERIWVAYCVTRRRKVTHDEWTSFLLDGKIISKILPNLVVHGLWKIIRSATSWWRARIFYILLSKDCPDASEKDGHFDLLPGISFGAAAREIRNALFALLVPTLCLVLT